MPRQKYSVSVDLSTWACSHCELHKPSDIWGGCCAGIILAYSNSVAGRLSDITVAARAGNIGCFFGGTLATLLSGTALILFTQFGSLGKEDALTTRKPAKA